MLISSTEPFRYGLLYGFIVVPYTVNKVASRCRTATKSKNIKLDFLNCKIEPLVKSQEFRNLFSNKTYTFIRFINYTIKPPLSPYLSSYRYYLYRYRSPVHKLLVDKLFVPQPPRHLWRKVY